MAISGALWVAAGAQEIPRRTPTGRAAWPPYLRPNERACARPACPRSAAGRALRLPLDAPPAPCVLLHPSGECAKTHPYRASIGSAADHGLATAGFRITEQSLPCPPRSALSPERLSIFMAAHHAQKCLLVVANARRSPSHVCALRLARACSHYFPEMQNSVNRP